jgi:hypothetical protein
MPPQRVAHLLRGSSAPCIHPDREAGDAPRGNDRYHASQARYADTSLRAHGCDARRTGHDASARAAQLQRKGVDSVVQT